jgi:hypothetical protein
MVHPGKTDWWIGGLLSILSAGFLVGGGTVLGMAVVYAAYPALVPGAALLLAGGMIFWILRGTSCEITETRLIIRAGPFRWTIRLDAIEEVVPSGAWGGPVFECNFGLAVSGLRIRYRTRRGGLSWPIRVAPQDRAAFLLELAERVPALVAKDDGSLRRPTQPDPTA